MTYQAGEFDIAVIGAGHAGIEASLAAARLGAKVAMFSINMDWIGNMPCNPSIGGTSKGHLVREIDALGGEMGKAADKNTLQSRMLNLGKGPAVHSLRAQIDRRRYSEYMKFTTESQENLTVLQAEIVSIKMEGSEVSPKWILKTRLEAIYTAKCVIIATGTFLGGKIYIGDVSYEGGPDGMFPATELSKSLKALGVQTRRFKTGTPARVNKRSLNFEKMEEQNGDEKIVPFSFEKPFLPQNKLPCHMTYTNTETKRVILESLDRSPLFSGKIDGVGPRYCPSIEDKIVRFADKERHQLFVEPCGEFTQEMYLQGMSSSLPQDVQESFIHTIEGLENAQIMRPAYAIEYDCADPQQMDASLEFKAFSGLFGAGQFNGSSGYEEAAAQGLIAGINAARKVQGKEKLILDRASSYIGTLIDDLVTKGCTDPYRMMTGRSEYRLILRQDNADLRLTPIGYEIGLISKERFLRLEKKKEEIQKELKRIQSVSIPMSDSLNRVLEENGTESMKKGCKLIELLKRPQLNYEILKDFDPERPPLSDEIMEQVQISVKYEGYIKRQLAQVKEMRRLEKVLLPKDIDFQSISGLRMEAQEKLSKVRPLSIGQASRISGVSPADISVLLIFLRKQRG